MHDEYLMKLASTRCIRRMVSKQSTYLFGLWTEQCGGGSNTNDQQKEGIWCHFSSQNYYQSLQIPRQDL